MNDPLNPDSEIMAVTRYQTNADLIVDVKKLGIFKPGDRVLDATYGNGVWWRKFTPDILFTSDLYEGNPQFRFDFCHMPFVSESFDVVAYDPPYKLNGTGTNRVDQPYGVHIPGTREERIQLMRDGFVELSRLVARGGFILVKCQNQVNGGRVRFQMIDMANLGFKLGLELYELLLPQFGFRPQPEGRDQVHARQNYSCLLVFKKPKRQGKIYGPV